MRVEYDEASRSSVLVDHLNKLSKKHSEICADYLIKAELVNVKSHGLARLKMYCDRIRKKLINPKPKIKIKKISSSISYVNADNSCLAYVYDTPNGRKYNEVMYNKEQKKLVYRSSDNEITVLDVCVLSRARAYSLIYEKRITVNDFELENKPLSSASATSQLIKITLAAYLKNDVAVSTAKSIQIKTRNWQ